ncbi:PREDICTED: protein RRP5 homolog isoform X2 [Dinoponera quadriceps]|nr:PREDICTED: protein RRP5 homolog isoform X2 [Dinoponera quadriceps]
MTLKSFPRGGKKVEVKKSSNVLFVQKPKSNKKHKTESKKQHNDTIAEETAFVANTAGRLSNATLCEGMILLGRISKVTEYELIVSIPGGLLGHVQVTDLSESYTIMIQNIINTEGVQTDEFKSLPDLYDTGDYVVCYVKSVNPDGKWLYSLSLEPQFINQNIDNSYLMKNTKIACSIKSMEDHGYVVDTGIANVRAFLATKHVDKEKKYFPGNQIICAIKEIKTVDQVSVIKLLAKKKKVDSVSTHDIESLDALTPGTKLSLCVTKVLTNGLQVTFGKDQVGYINQIYLDNPLSTYVDDTEVTGTLLYIMPTVKFAYFSLLTDESEKERLQVGDVIKKAKVLYRESNGIIFKLTKSRLRGFVSLRRTDVPFDKVPRDFERGSVHRCRILSYNWMEHLYVCTMEKETLQQRYFSLTDLKIGDILTVRLTKIDAKFSFVHVQVGKIYGVVAPEHVSDNGPSELNKLKVGDNVEARVLSINNEKRNVRFTLKRSLIKSELPILQDINEAQSQRKYHGTINKINKNGLLVRFYGDVKGWVPRTVLDSNISDINWNYTVGQTVRVLIDSVEKNENRMKLRIITGERKQLQPVGVKIGDLVEGTVVESSVEGIHLRIRKTDDEEVAIGFLPAGHMSPCMEIGSLLASKCTPGDTMSAYVFSTQPSVIMSCTYVTQEQYRSFDALKVGDCIPCTIRDISQDGVRVILPIEDYSTFGFVLYKNISNYELLRVNQILFVKVTTVNKREKQLGLTMALKDVWESPLEHGTKMLAAVDVLSLYLNKLSELATNVFYKNKPISSVTLGQKVYGKVEKITEHGLVLRLDNQLTGVVRKDHYVTEPKVGDKVYGTILWKNYIHELVDVSLLPRIVNGISSKQKKLPQLPETIVLRGEILMITNWLILVLVKRGGSGYLLALPVRRHLNDLAPDLRPYVVHAKIRLYVVLKGNESDIVPIGMLKSAFETPRATAKQSTSGADKKLKRKTSAQQEDAASTSAKKPKVEVDDGEADDGGAAGKRKSKNKASNIDRGKTAASKKSEASGRSGKAKAEVGREHEEEGSMKKKRIKKKVTAEEEGVKIKSIDEISASGEDSTDESSAENTLSIAERPHIPECGFNWDDTPSSTVVPVSETSSDDEEEPAEEPKKKKKKPSAAERREQERQKEREIRQREEALASNQMPNSIDQFDRLVLSSPDSSLVWLQYMAYHLQATEIDKARAVARRAIKAINFREENEQLNVWNAWLNLESKYGTSDSLNDVFQEAVKANDALKVYTHMLSVHVDAGRRAELEKLITTMTGKFKQDFGMWVDCGAAFLKIGLKEKSRHVMQRALQSLPASQHVNLMVRFANLENKLGDKERSQTLFEQILSSYPKRVDVWSSYIDCLVKTGDLEIARRVLNRAVAQTLPVRKMRTLFQKFVSFEEKHGTSEDVARVHQLAASYVEKQCSKEST